MEGGIAPMPISLMIHINLMSEVIKASCGQVSPSVMALIVKGCEF